MQRLPLVGASTLFAPSLAHLREALLMLYLFVQLLALPAGATQTNWKLTTNGNFSTTANWDNGVPDSTKVADFGLGLGAATYTVTYNGAASGFPPPQYQANQIIISGTNNVTFARNTLQAVAPSLTATNTDATFATPGLLIGQFSGDNTTFNDSVFTNVTQAVIGNVASSTGTLNVSGAGMNYSQLVIGYQGMGSMKISGGTHVTGTATAQCYIGYTGTAGNHGELTVTGAGSMLSANYIYVGDEGEGNFMTISSGAQVSTGTQSYIGWDSSSRGTVFVDGAGSNWSSASLFVGHYGSGGLEITNGAQVSALDAIIGDKDGSSGTVTIDGAGSKLTSGEFGPLQIGNSGSATVFVSHGGALVHQGGASLGGDGFTSSIGTIIIDGAGSTWTGGSPEIGNGTLSITDGGTVSTTGTTDVGFEPFTVASATVDGNGSTWTMTGGMNLGTNLGRGTVTVRNGGLVSVGSPIAIGALGKITGDGTISGAVTNGGVVAPGSTIGALHITGSYTQSAAGTLEIELAGTTPGTKFDRLVVSGSVTLGGTLNVALLNGFMPAGASFDILDWGSLTGTFSSLQLPTLPNGLQWNTSQLYTAGVLSVGVPGDFNGNGVVDAADFVVWRKGLGTTYTQNDYNVWRANFGQQGGGGSGATVNAAVPEPSTLVLLIFAAAGWCFRRGRTA
jgi:T5SS/PEP-CTERM-associated repeat protein